MEWLVAIIGILIVVRLWRIFLPIIGIAALGLGAFYLYNQHKTEPKKGELQSNEQKIAQRLAAVASKSNTSREWTVLRMEDPASGEQVRRMARIESNDGLCYLNVEKRLNGTELTGLQCSLLRISEWSDIEVKFDNYPDSDAMNIESYSDSDGVYIRKYQTKSDNKLPYDEFIRRLSGGKAVAIKIPTEGSGTHWTTFSLRGSRDALAELYRDN